MRALTVGQRAFVTALLETGSTNHSRCAAMAGYTGSPETLAATGSRLAHDSKVQAAIQEEAVRRMHAGAIMATSQLLTIAETSTSDMTKLRAIEMILNRVGMHAKTEHQVKVEHGASDAGTLLQIQQIAARLGLDPVKLLGDSASKVPAGPVIDAVFEEVGHSTEGLEDLL